MLSKIIDDLLTLIPNKASPRFADIQHVHSLLTCRSKLNPKDPQVCRVMHLAMSQRSHDLVTLLRENGADITSLETKESDSHQYNSRLLKLLLELSPEKDFPQVSDVQTICERVKEPRVLTSPDVIAARVFLYALISRDKKLTQFLLDNGMSRSAYRGPLISQYAFHLSKLWAAATLSTKAHEMISHMLGWGSGYDTEKEENGDHYRIRLSKLLSEAVPLKEFPQRTDIQYIHSILTKGKTLDPKDVRVYKALLYAIIMGDFEVVQFLLENGADPNSKNENGLSLLWAATIRGTPYTHMAELLLKHGAALDPQEKYCSATLFFNAAFSGNRALLQILFERKASLQVRDGKTGLTPLHGAALNGFFDIVKVLVEKGADIDVKADTKVLEMLKGHPGVEPDFVLMFISKTGKMEREETDQTPYDCAEENGHTKIAEYLLEVRSKEIEQILREQTNELPKFKYHPGPIETQMIKKSFARCECCMRKRGFVYTGVTSDESDPLCPWCIFDGAAGKKFEIWLNHLSDYKIPQHIIEEIHFRTPGFISWQEMDWAVHCNDACEYHGMPKAKYFRTLDQNQIDRILEEANMDQEVWEQLMEDITPETEDCVMDDPEIHLFICRHCREKMYQICYS